MDIDSKCQSCHHDITMFHGMWYHTDHNIMSVPCMEQNCDCKEATPERGALED